MNSPFLVLLAIGTAALHDTGRRLEMPVVAPNRLEAACIAERNGNVIVGDCEYVHALKVTPIRTSHFSFTPGPSLAMAV